MERAKPVHSTRQQSQTVSRLTDQVPGSFSWHTAPVDQGIRTGWILLASAAFFIIWFVPLGFRDLITPDEGRYAELALGMFRSGDWITPRLNGVLYFHKPPLQYWATALAYSVFGVNEFSARLWPALTSALAVLAVGFAAQRLYGRHAGLFSAAVLGSTGFWVANGHFLTLDAAFSSFLAMALMAFVVAQHEATTTAHRTIYMLLAWSAMALAVLSKGLAGIVIPGGALVFYLLATRQWILLTRLHLIKGTAWLLLITAPWFVVVSLRNPEFAHYFFIHEHFARYTTEVHDRAGPWWTFIVLLPLGLLPWLPWFVQAVRKAADRDQGANFQPGLFVLAWVAFIMLFFSFSSSKLPSYILPVFPALALLIGRALADPQTHDPRRTLVAMALLVGTLAAAAPFLARFYRGSEVIAHAHRLFGFWIAGAFALFALALWAAMLLLENRKGLPAGRWPAVASIAFLSLLATLVAMTGHQVYADTKSAKTLAAHVRPLLTPQTALFVVNYYDQSLPFYFDRSLVFVDYLDEFAFGLGIEPSRHVPTLEAFVVRWNNTADAAAVLQRPVFETLIARGLKAKVVYEDPRRLAIRTP